MKKFAFSLFLAIIVLGLCAQATATEATLCDILPVEKYVHAPYPSTITSYTSETAANCDVTIPAGYSDTVWYVKGTQANGESATLDFTDCQIPAENVYSVTMRVYLPTDSSSTELPSVRFTVTGNTVSGSGYLANTGAFNMGSTVLNKADQWTDIVLTEAHLNALSKSFAKLADDDGNFVGFDISVRHNGIKYFFIDSVTVQTWEDYYASLPAENDDDVTFTVTKPVDGDSWYSGSGVTATSIKKYTYSEATEAGIPTGFDGNVWEITAPNNKTAVGAMIEFPTMKIPVDSINSISFRVYAPTDSGTNQPEFRIAYTRDGGNVWTVRWNDSSLTEGGKWQTISVNADSYDFSNLDFDGDGYLDRFNLIVRRSGASPFYIDTVSVDYDDTECLITESAGTYKTDKYVCYGSKAVTVYTETEAATAGIPAGFTDKVWQPSQGNGAGVGALLDFTALGIKVENINSIKFRVYVSSDVSELRINDPSPNDIWLLRKAIDTETWVDVTLDSAAFTAYGFDKLADVDGYLDKFELTVRSSTATPTFYIDSVTVDYDEPSLTSEFTQFKFEPSTDSKSTYFLFGSKTVTEMTAAQAMLLGAPAGAEGNVLYVADGNSAGVGVILDFDKSDIPTTIIDSMTFRVYAEDFDGGNTSYPALRIKKGEFPFRRDVLNFNLNGKTGWTDVTLSSDGSGFSSIKNFHALAGKGSNSLHKFELAVAYGTRGGFFIDSVTVKLKADDKEAPVITYKGEDTVYTSLGAELLLDASAYDKTEKRNVEVEYDWSSRPTSEGTYTLTLRACDYYGNESSKTLTVVVGEADTEKPVINLGKTIYAETGTVPADNADVTDNDCVKSVTYTYSDGALDERGTLTKGTHTLTIVAYDCSNNFSSKTVTVIVDDDIAEDDNVIDESNITYGIDGGILGAQIRTDDPQGLRFATKIKFSDVIALSDIWCTDDDDTLYAGTLVVPKELLDSAGIQADKLTHKNMSSDVADVKAKNIYESNADDNTAAVYTAVVTDIPVEGKGTEIVARPYIYRDGFYCYFTPIIRSVTQIENAMANNE